MKGGKNTDFHPLVRSQPVLYLSTWAVRDRPLSFLVWSSIADDASTIEAAKSNFFPFIDPFLDPLLEREVTHAMRHMPSPLAVRVCKYFGALCLRAAPYSPPYPRVHKRSRSNSHPVRNFYFSIGCETTKRVTPILRGDIRETGRDRCTFRGA